MFVFAGRRLRPSVIFAKKNYVLMLNFIHKLHVSPAVQWLVSSIIALVIWVMDRPTLPLLSGSWHMVSISTRSNVEDVKFTAFWMDKEYKGPRVLAVPCSATLLGWMLPSLVSSKKASTYSLGSWVRPIVSLRPCESSWMVCTCPMLKTTEELRATLADPSKAD
jgi:hypothetical protein